MIWARLADWVLPAVVLRFERGLDGYRPPAPAGMAWYAEATRVTAPAWMRRNGRMLVADRFWWRLGAYPPLPPPRPRSGRP